MKEKIVLKETQYFLLSVIPSVLICIVLLIAEIYDLGSKPAPFFVTTFAILFIIFFVLLTYKMSIVITKNLITIKFGVGIIKKKIPISDIQISTIKKTSLAWYYGAGIRFFNDGVIYNTKSGEGIEFKTFAKTYRIGTNKVYEILKILKEIKLAQ